MGGMSLVGLFVVEGTCMNPLWEPHPKTPHFFLIPPISSNTFKLL